jgi:UDP:flavonoid glycosyltransferase YjiC (YdhE family)
MSTTEERTRITKRRCKYLYSSASYLSLVVRAPDRHPHSAGIPQTILAQWFDLYDMAVRAEYVGIGIYGNQSVAPEIDVTEFGAAVSRLLVPGEAEKFARKAKEVGEACKMAPGKKGVAAKILELAEDKNSEG